MSESKKPKVDEARGRKFQKIMESEWNHELLSVAQADQVMKMSKRLRDWMKKKLEITYMTPNKSGAGPSAEATEGMAQKLFYVYHPYDKYSYGWGQVGKEIRDSYVRQADFVLAVLDSAIQKAMTKAINDCIEEAKMVEVPSTDHRAGSSDAYYVKDNIIERLEAIRSLLKPGEPEVKK